MGGLVFLSKAYAIRPKQQTVTYQSPVGMWYEANVQFTLIRQQLCRTYSPVKLVLHKIK